MILKLTSSSKSNQLLSLFALKLVPVKCPRKSYGIPSTGSRDIVGTTIDADANANADTDADTIEIPRLWLCVCGGGHK